MAEDALALVQKFSESDVETHAREELCNALVLADFVLAALAMRTNPMAGLKLMIMNRAKSSSRTGRTGLFSTTLIFAGSYF